MQDSNNKPAAQGAAAPATTSAGAMKQFQEETVNKVMDQITTMQEAGAIRLPSDYAVGNQLKLAWLKLLTVEDRSGRKALEVCTKESICNALLEMVVQGMSVAKKQGDFIVYGNKLTFSLEYHGTIALARRVGGVVGVPAGNVIYEGDDFVYTINPATGRKEIVRHGQDIKNIDMNKIIGAYATLQLEDGSTFVEIMTMSQIRQAWQQGATKGQSPAHKNFPDQMAIKTVIGRACKLFISTSDDAGLFSDDEKQEHSDQQQEQEPTPKRSAKKLGMDTASEPEDATIIDDKPTAPAKAEAPSRATQAPQQEPNAEPQQEQDPAANWMK